MQIHYRQPTTSDAIAISDIVRQANNLDNNSHYAHLLWCSHFKNTCRVAQHGTELVGFVSGYYPPNESDSLFVWQIAVVELLQQKGIGFEMLLTLIDSQECLPTWLITTVTPSNVSSIRLFTALAKLYDAKLERCEYFSAALFPMPDNHESEILYRIGPIKKNANGSN